MTGGRDRRRGDRRRQPEGESTPSVPWWERRFGQDQGQDTMHGSGQGFGQAPGQGAGQAPGQGAGQGAGQGSGQGFGQGAGPVGPGGEYGPPTGGRPRTTGEYQQPELDVSALRQSAGTGGHRARADQDWQGAQAQPSGPGGTGEYPRTTGEYARPTGEHPRSTGEYPRAGRDSGRDAGRDYGRSTGEYPGPTGEHRVPTGEWARSSGEYPAAPGEQPSPYAARGDRGGNRGRSGQPARQPQDGAQHQAAASTLEHAQATAHAIESPTTDRMGSDTDASARAEAEPPPVNERTTGSHSRVPARSGRFTLPTIAVRPLDLQVLTWWFLTRVSLLVIAVSAPALFQPDTGAPGLLERWANWDVAHFVEIAENGYFREAWETPVEAFFPGLPMIMRLGLVVGISPVVTGMVVSLLAGGVAAVALARLAEAEYGEGAGQKAALAWMVAPPGVFLAAPYTEALFLGFAIPAWLAARRGHWWLAGALTFGACAVRVSGIFLLVALAVEFLTSKRRGSWENAGWLALPLVPLLAYMGYLWANTGDALAWYNAQASGWYREFHWPWQALLNTVRAAQGEGYGAPDAAMHANWEWMFRAELVAMLLGVVVTVVLLTMRRWSEATWIGVQLAAFSTSTWFFSVPRATLLWFPLWIGLGALSRTRPWLWRGYIVIAAPLFGLWASAFLLGRWAG